MVADTLGEWFHERGQQRRLNDLESGLDAAYSSMASKHRALRSHIAQVRGSLETRLDRMATAFDAFVELSDLRTQLALFHREEVARYRTGLLTQGLARRLTDPSIPPPPPLELEDVPSYWLETAAEGLSALFREDTEQAERLIAESLRRDEGRASLFFTLATTLGGSPGLSERYLEAAFGPLGGTPSRAQRVLWRASAAGVYGETGFRLTERRLSEVVSALREDGLAAEENAWQQAADGLSAPASSDVPGSLRSAVDRGSGLSKSILASRRLARLRSSIEEALTAEPAQTALDDGLTREFADVLAGLIDEGSAEEIPLRARARELRRAIEGGGEPVPDSWDAPSGSTFALLREHVFAGSEPRLRAVAVRAAGPLLASTATALADVATAKPPEELAARIRGLSVRITAASPADLDRADAAIDQYHATSSLPERVAAGSAAIGVLVAVAGIALGAAGLGILAVIIILAAGITWVAKRGKRRRTEQARDEEKAALKRAAIEAAGDFATLLDRLGQAAKTATADRDAIHELLA